MKTLIKRVVKRLQIREVHSLVKDVLVKGAREEAIQQLVVVNRFGHNSANEFEVAQVIRVAVGAGIRLVGDPVPGGGSEQGIIGVEHFPGHDHKPLPQQPAGILPLFSFKHHVQPAFHLLRGSSMELAERIFKHVFSSHVNR